jgi:hypothetical protein
MKSEWCGGFRVSVIIILSLLFTYQDILNFEYIYVMHIFMDMGEYKFLDLHTPRYVHHVGI